MTHLHRETLEKIKADAQQPRARDRCEGCGDLLAGCLVCGDCDQILCEECFEGHRHDGGDDE